MTNHQSSWRIRRWKLFLTDYDSNVSFRNALNEEYEIYKGNAEKGKALIRTTLYKNKIPFACYEAVLMFLSNPNLKESEYQKLIASPLVINPDFEGYGVSPSDVSGTLLLVSPFINKSELKELIDEHYDDFNKPTPKDFDLSTYSRLEGKIRPSKTRQNAKRDELIRTLHKAGRGDHFIAVELREQRLADNEITANRVKQIRFRMGLTKKKKS